MNRKHSFDEALNAGIDALRAGQPLESVLKAHPQYAAMLRPLLETATDIHDQARPAPKPERLESNYAFVRSALRDAQGAQRPLPRRRTTWWGHRRLAFASFSLPAVAVAAIALAGAGGAAAATLAVMQPSIVGRVADAITPDWVQNATPLGHDGGDGSKVRPSDSATPNAVAADGGNSTPTPSPASGDAVAVTGVIGELRGHSFTLTSEGAVWHVVMRRETDITGAVVDGAAASVSGRTSGGTLHADSIAVTDSASTSPGSEETQVPGNSNGNEAPGNSGGAPGQSGTPPPGNSGGAPGQSGTPPGNSGSAPGQSSTPPGNSGGGPGQSSTPPGNSGGAPGQTKTPPGLGNGNGGGPKKP